MTNYARIINNIAVDVSTNPTESFHPEIASQFVSVPDNVVAGWELVNGVWGEVAALEVIVVPPTVSVIEYKMLFTSQERVATKNSADPVIVDLQELMNDPRTTNVDLSLKSISDALDYMTTLNILGAGRKAEILTGIVK
jgi:hypothetical protein